MVLRDADRRLHEASELLLAVHNLHSSTAEDIRWADEDRISNASGDIPDIVEAVSGGGLGLPNPRRPIIAENFRRSSARSIDAGGVPRIRVRDRRRESARASGIARLIEVCPPN